MSKKKTKAQKRFDRQKRMVGGNVTSSVEKIGNTLRFKQTYTADDFDNSWDAGNDEQWDEKYDQWESRDWESWLKENLSFPFTARREDDDGSSFCGNVDKGNPFTLGNTMQVVGLEWDPGNEMFWAKVKKDNKTGMVPLCDLEVVEKTNDNYWPVREFAVWVGNR